MRKQLGLLVELQQVDLKLDMVQANRAEIEDKMVEIDRQITISTDDLANSENNLSTLRSEYSELEESFKAEEDNIDRSEKRLKEIKTQKEYQAVSKEITSAKKMLEELSEQLKEKGEVIAATELEVEEKRENLGKLVENSTARKIEYSENIDSIEQGAAGDKSFREKVAKEIPSSILRRYSQLRGQRRGIAVVEAKDGSCLGCNMNIPPQMYNNLFKSNEIMYCPHCQRVMYIVLPAADSQQ